MEIEHEGVKPDLGQSSPDDLQRSLLLGDEHHPLPAQHALGDHVGDGLGFACARRSLKHEGPALGGPGDGLHLCGIRRDGQAQRLQVLLLAVVRRGVDESLQWCVHQVSHEGVGQESVPVQVEVLPHAERCHIKQRQPPLGANREAEPGLSNRYANGFQRGVHIDAGLVGGWLLQRRDRQVVLAPQPLQQGEVGRHLRGGVDREASRAASQGSLEAHRDEDQGGIVQVALVVGPTQQPEGEEERIHALLVAGLSGLA